MSIDFKRHYPLLILLIATTLFFVLALGDTRIIAYTTGTADMAQAEGINYENSIALFDESIVHEIDIIISPADYGTMIQTYVETGEKDFFSADVIIDGVRVSNVGIRLKGGSTLASIYRGGEQGNVAPPAGEPPPPGDEEMRPPPQGGPGASPLNGEMNQPPPNVSGEGVTPFISPETREAPYLIKFDEYESGQSYQGYAEVAVRVRGHLEEDAAQFGSLLTRAIFAATDLPVSEMAYAGVRLNGGDEKQYLIAEHVDEIYTQKYVGEGVLYKALPQGTFNYHGEDPIAYAEIFEQKTRVNEEDFAPLIEFIRFVNQASDEEFERDLHQYLDIDSFAAYLAINNLLVNMDSLGGNGNNYYLYYNLKSRQFTVLAWDLNESLGQFWFLQTPSYELDSYYESEHPWNHPLRARFLESEDFKELYETKYRAFFEQVYSEGFALETIVKFAALFGAENAARNLSEQNLYDESVAHAKEFLRQREAFLLSQPLFQK